jgi:hypothetical protein
MPERIRRSAHAVLVALIAGSALLGCGGRESGREDALIGEEQKVQGTVVKAELTHCGPVPDKPGTCEGTIVVEPEGGGEATRVALEVTRDVALKKGDQTVFLQQLQGSRVSATYRATEAGSNMATSVVATP